MSDPDVPSAKRGGQSRDDEAPPPRRGARFADSPDEIGDGPLTPASPASGPSPSRASSSTRRSPSRGQTSGADPTGSKWDGAPSLDNTGWRMAAIGASARSTGAGVAGSSARSATSAASASLESDRAQGSAGSGSKSGGSASSASAISGPASSPTASSASPADEEATVRRTGSRVASQRRWSRRTALIAVLGTVLVVLVAGFSGYLVDRLNPGMTPSTGPTASWPLALPLSVAGYSRDANQGATPTTSGDGSQVVAANYSSNGEVAVVVLAARPVTDLTAFATESNLQSTTKYDNGRCGISSDTLTYGCVILQDNTGIFVLAKQDQSVTTLLQIAVQFGAQMAAG
jgi:hypothetical protein